MFKLVSSLVVLLFFISCVLADVPQCGEAVGGAFCLPGYCCSKEGFCGTTDPYCGCGCQNGPCHGCNPSGIRSIILADQPQCGRDAGGAVCPPGYCCSEYGFCGTTEPYCGCGCQSGPCHGCNPKGIRSIISRELFEQMLKHRNNAGCPAHGFYTYDAFIAAAKSFTEFGNTGDEATKKREIAAFLGQTSHTTSGGWPTAPDGPYSWGYCHKETEGPNDDGCVNSTQWPCAPGKKYYGRGPFNITYNYNYGPAGVNISYDLLNNPDTVAADPVISFKTALWFWMTPQSTKPSCHSVMVGQWTPSNEDKEAERLPGYGLTTNIINGKKECGIKTPLSGIDRQGFYMHYCDLLGVYYGENVDCQDQEPFDD